MSEEELVEELVEDDQALNDETDPEAVTPVESEEVAADVVPASDDETTKCAETKQLTGEEEVIGSGSDIIVPEVQHLDDKEHYKAVLKECFPHRFKMEFPDG